MNSPTVPIKRKKKNLILILNSPNNPSGAVCNNLDELAAVAKRYKLIVLSDKNLLPELYLLLEYSSLSH